MHLGIKKRPAKTEATPAKGAKKVGKNVPAAVKKVIKPAKCSPIGAAVKGSPRCKIPFPGVPTKYREPFVYNNVKIYCDLTMSKWRVKAKGVRVDKAIGWSKDPSSAWKKVLVAVDSLSAVGA